MKIVFFFAALLTLTVAQDARSQYPSRPIRYIVPFPAGGSADGIAHIPYKGDAPTTADLIGRRIQFAFMAPVPGLAQAREGRLRMLAVLLPQRSTLVPEVPTIAEAGMHRNVVARLSRDLNAVLSRADVREQIGRQGVEVQVSTPDELAAHTKAQYQAWTRVIRETNIPRE